MRDNCLNCARKHLAQALILMIEVLMSHDYRDHKWIAIAHIAEAESELCIKWKDIAWELREHRKAYESNGDYVFPIMKYIRRLGEEEERLSAKEL